MTTERRPLQSQISPNIFIHAGTKPRTPRYERTEERNARRRSRSRSSPSRQDEDGDSNGGDDDDDEVSSTTTRRCRSRPRSRSALKSQLRLVFFITGNPGLVAYYHPFLSFVVRDLTEQKRERCADADADVVVVVGMSLGGFDVRSTHGTHGGEGARKRRGGGAGAGSYSKADSHPGSRSRSDSASLHEWEEQRLLYPATFKRGGGKLFTLRDQVDLSYARVEDLVDRIQHEQDGQPVEVDVVLMGHSVGAYICLEVVRLWHERHTAGQDIQTSSNTSTPAKVTLSSRSAPLWSPTACILLTPTIQDIHLSPSGLIATPLLTNLPFLPFLAQILVRSVLLRLVPASWFAALVSRVTGMQPGSHGLEATLVFLRSEEGVEQALHMASWEMEEIRQNRWGTEVWGASHGETLAVAAEEKRYPSPRLFFWFSKDDHWVAEMTKKAIIEGQAPGTAVHRRHVAGSAETAETDEIAVQVDGTKETFGASPTIRILESEGLQHAWCLAQSEIVAKGVRQWL
ncbi:hypothetical protein A1O7_03316 [Cladophialophora yegresii CBS 114405]|uniref:Uncharacterized protein n=1 Tax=Cladophialophora yegresii CBS 114405 TaxID=1182544 RepID=W9WXA0_9EURO|nr:uncharacterized protein A1O7_03316 [Cladophialophora yegresii CBS 114405]EXJ62874.1 hypothetical protein A1O7_03316 [Cladophialophora yegresii CBS 114405]